MELSRRDFFKKSAAGALALGLAGQAQAAGKAGFVSEVTGKPKAKRVIMIALDGICVAGFEKAWTPNLDALLAEGVLSVQTRVVMPSVTLPNWTSMMTASGPEQHGVVDNSWRLDNVKLPAIEKDADGYYPSVFQLLKEQVPGMKTAFYYNWAELINPYNKKYLDEIGFLEEDAYVPNYEKAFAFVEANRANPTLVFLYTVHTDHAGHAHKWMSPEYIQSIEEADVEIGKLLEKFKAADLYDDSHFLFLTDHGGIEYGHGGTSPDEMIVPWGIKGPGVAKGLRMKAANNTFNTGRILLHLFGAKQPDCWIGEIPETIFK